MGLAAAAVGLFFVGAAVVVVGAFLVAGWATVRGSVFTLELTRRQQGMFATSTVALPATVVGYFLGFGTASVVLLFVGGVALLIAVLWTVVAAVGDRFATRGRT